MSSTSDQMTQQNKKTRLIIDEVGVDTETGIIGKGHSYDNGETFTVDDTIYGRIYHADDHGKIWKGIQDKVKTVVEPAKSAADSAVAYANDAIEKSRVNSQAMDDINSAVSDAVSDAAVARSDGLRAWNAAQSNVNLIDLNYASASASISSARTEAIAAADEAKMSASAARADIVAARSDVAAVQADVTATRSDVAVAKSDIADTKTSLTSQAKGLSSYAAQASAAGQDITTLKSQAGQFEQDMADTKGDVSQLKVSASAASVALSDAAGNISSLQATAKSYSAALSDTNSNVASVTATAKELETKYADAAGNISTLQANAKGMTQTISDAQGDIAKLKTRADGFDAEFATANGNINKLQTDASGTTQTLANTKSDVAVLQSRADGLDAKYADAAGDINTLKTNASGISQTLTNAQGDISTLKSTVSGVQTTLTDAQGNISTLQSDVSGLKKTTSDNAGNISTLQSTAKTLTSQMSSAQGDISTFKQTASGISSQVTALSSDFNNLSQSVNLQTLDSADINDMKTNGDYFVHNLANNPIGGWVYVDVVGNGNDRIRQDVYQDLGNQHCYRRWNGSAWTAWSQGATESEITANTTAIEQNKQAIALKADQTTVDKTNGTVQKLQSQLQVQAGQIATKVSSSDLDAKGYVTQTYTQTQIKQTADRWNATLTSVKDGLTQSYTNLHATVDGIQAQVYNSDGSSKITQLSNMIATKVSQGDYNSQITQLKNDINLRVTKGDLISQINLQAGTSLIQSNKLVLDAGTTVFTGEAFIPSAAISSISADKIMLGSTSLWNTDGTLNLVNQSNNLKALIQVKQGLVQDTTQSIISFSSDYNNRSFSVTPIGATITPTLFFERYDQTAGHWLGFSRNKVRNEGLTFHTWDDDGERFFVNCHARFDRNISATGNIYQGSWNGTTGKPLAGILSIQSGNTIWSGSDYLAIGDHISNSFTDVKAKSFSQQSTLSSKTNIEEVDPKDALDLVNQTDIRSYQYKSDVAQGKTKRYTSLIIDDVNDVSQYHTPDAFINDDRTGRDDGSAVGYLFLAVKELTRRIENLEEKLNG